MSIKMRYNERAEVKRDARNTKGRAKRKRK